MSILKDLPKDNNSVSKATKMKFRLFLAEITDVDIDNFPKPVNATISTNVLKAGKVYRFLDVKTTNMKPNAQPGDSPFEGKLVLTPVIEGVSKASLSWIYEYQGKEVIVIWERCSDGQRFIGGSPCSDGLTIKYTSIGDQDGGIAGIALSLEGQPCPEPFLFYDGPIPVEAPTNVVVANGEFALGAKASYLMTDNSADTDLTDITGVTSADVDRVIELIGAGVNHPTQIEASSTFILQNGISFSAAVGNAIYFQIVKTGVDTYAFYEIHRG